MSFAWRSGTQRKLARPVARRWRSAPTLCVLGLTVCACVLFVFPLCCGTLVRVTGLSAVVLGLSSNVGACSSPGSSRRPVSPGSFSRWKSVADKLLKYVYVVLGQALSVNICFCLPPPGTVRTVPKTEYYCVSFRVIKAEKRRRFHISRVRPGDLFVWN